MRKPDENHGEFYQWLLGRNARLYGVAFSCDRIGDVYLGRSALARLGQRGGGGPAARAGARGRRRLLRPGAGDRVRLVDPARVGLAGQARGVHRATWRRSPASPRPSAARSGPSAPSSSAPAGPRRTPSRYRSAARARTDVVPARRDCGGRLGGLRAGLGAVSCGGLVRRPVRAAAAARDAVCGSGCAGGGAGSPWTHVAAPHRHLRPGPARTPRRPAPRHARRPRVPRRAGPRGRLPGDPVRRAPAEHRRCG